MTGHFGHEKSLKVTKSHFRSADWPHAPATRCNLGAVLVNPLGGLFQLRRDFACQRGTTHGASPQRAVTEEKQSWRAKDPSAQ